jgi:protein TonB
VQPPLSPGPDIADAVLSATGRERTIRLPLTLLAAFAVHAAILVGVHHTTLGAQVLDPPTGPAKKEDEFELAPLEPPPPPAVVPERTIREHREALAKAPSAAAHAERAPGHEAAQAATVLAQIPNSATPFDLTADTVVTGTATAYSGGVTASNGTSASPGEQAPSRHQAPSSVAVDWSIPVSLASESWSCPWPHEADAEQINEQTVVLRIVVAAGGDPESVTVVSEPGHGFGAAAVVCASRTHFTPARDRSGEPVRATSPPIRVRFTR